MAPAPWNLIFRMVILAEDVIVARILRSPSFHHAVRGIHRRVEDYRHGRDPNEPLRQGEATREQGSRSDGKFLSYFVEELRNQFRGTPTQNSPTPPPPPGNRHAQR